MTVFTVLFDEKDYPRESYVTICKNKEEIVNAFYTHLECEFDQDSITKDEMDGIMEDVQNLQIDRGYTSCIMDYHFESIDCRIAVNRVEITV